MTKAVTDRLRALREAAGLTKSDMARRMGIPYSSYTHYEYRFKDAHLPIPVAESLVKAFNGTPIDPDDVMELAGIVAPVRVENGTLAPPSAQLVPVFDVAASAGHGAISDYESIAYSMAFPSGYLQKLTRTDPRNLAIISVKGDSMIPTLMDDDVVMVDTSKRSVDFDGLFVFRFGDALHIKRVTRGKRRDTFIAISDNRALYDPVEYQAGDVDVIGRVIWYGRRV